MKIKVGSRYVLSMARTGRIISTTADKDRAGVFEDSDYYMACAFSFIKRLNLNITRE